jgi:glutathione S-transferase
MDWVSVDEARQMPGLRIVLAKGVWAVWGECAKAIFHVKKIPYAPVPQIPFEANPGIVAWTGVRNQPQVVYENEPVRTGWLDILNLAERIAPTPVLLPKDAEQRATVVGMANELCGENGLGWCKRLQAHQPNTASDNTVQIMRTEYGLTEGDVADEAEQRMAGIVSMLAGRLKAQKAAGSHYFVGDGLTALDLYWACFSNLVDPLPHELAPMPQAIREAFNNPGRRVRAVMDPILFDHRDYINLTYLRLPLDFG